MRGDRDEQLWALTPLTPDSVVRGEAQSGNCSRPSTTPADGTLLDAWASMNSVRPRDQDGVPPEGGGRNQSVDFKGQQRRNETHVSRTDPEARLAKKGARRGGEARLRRGHVSWRTAMA